MRWFVREYPQKSPIHRKRALYICKEPHIYNFLVSHASCDGVSANIRKRALYIAKEPYISAKSPKYIIFSFHMHHAMVCPQKDRERVYMLQRALHMLKRARYMLKRALYMLKRAIYMLKRALFNVMQWCVHIKTEGEERERESLTYFLK